MMVNRFNSYTPRAGLWVFATTAALAAFAFSAAPAMATVAWSVRSFADPTNFSPHNEEVCNGQERCDQYQLVVRNTGDTISSGPLEVTDKLPAGITTTGKSGPSQRVEGYEGNWTCTAPESESEKVTVVKCTDPYPVRPEAYAATLKIPVTAPGPALVGSMTNEVSVSGGGATGLGSTVNTTAISTEPTPFEVTDFGFDAATMGATDAQAAGHPGEVTASLDFSNVFQPPTGGA